MYVYVYACTYVHKNHKVVAVLRWLHHTILRIAQALRQTLSGLDLPDKGLALGHTKAKVLGFRV